MSRTVMMDRLFWTKAMNNFLVLLSLILLSSPISWARQWQLPTRHWFRRHDGSLRIRGGIENTRPQDEQEPYSLGLHAPHSSVENSDPVESEAKASPSPSDLENDNSDQTAEAPSLEVQDSDTDVKDEDGNDNDDDDERYSRQVYTLGKRAHSLIRSTTVYLDAPLKSGLMYEVAKNLALSGIHQLVLIIRDDDEGEEDEARQLASKYHMSKFDDLGAAYVRAATVECYGNAGDGSPTSEDLILEYVKRLNPAVHVKCLRLKKDDDISTLSNDGDPIVFMPLDRPTSEVRRLNEWVRSSDSIDVKFISVDTAGAFAQIFVDLGKEFYVHDADGETPARIPLLEVTKEEADDEDSTDTYFLHCMPGEKHDVSKGDLIEFHLRNGDVLNSVECRVERVLSPFKVRVTLVSEAESALPIQQQVNQAVSFSRKKEMQLISFVPYGEALEERKLNGGLITPSDLDKSFDSERQDTLLGCFSSLDAFVSKYGRLPIQADKEDVKAMKHLVAGTLSSNGADEKDGNESTIKKNKLSKKMASLVKKFSNACAAKFTPLQGVMGAIAAQESLKAASGLYTPIHQFLLFDCEEVLKPDGSGTSSSSSDSAPDMDSSDTPGLCYILGDKFIKAFQRQRLFVVGAGAIGCELLKNLAAMGAATNTVSSTGTKKKQRGKLIVTDMDTIEKSNLSRQLLFRDSDLGNFKSVAAEQAAKMFNKDCVMDVHSSKVGDGDASPFDERFWSKEVDIVLNALDNVDARLYMDGQCVKYHKALVDAGTLGPKGNVQVVVPKQSESYASSADPPDEAIPVCTLKNFPYAISHTIQWARDLFDGLFVQRAQQANDFVESIGGATLASDEDGAKLLADLADKMLHEAGEEAALVTAQEVTDDLLAIRESEGRDGSKRTQGIRSESLKWAIGVARKLYVDSVDSLLAQHPLDSKDEDGEVFWSGTRRPPSRLTFQAGATDPETQVLNENLISFVQNGARLRAEMYLPSDESTTFTPEEAKDALISSSLTANTDPSVCKDEATPSPSKHEQILKTLSKIPMDQIRSSENEKFNMADFEKDDESNGHVAFITAASNLRALGYGIPPVDSMETRRVAGKIIPAMISTTAFVSALSCLELVKLVQKSPLQSHRNAFINLALPFFAFTAPLPAETTPGLNGKEYTLWDQLAITESKKAADKGGMTVKALLKRIRKLAASDGTAESDEGSIDNVQVASLSLGPFLLYANFLHEDDKDLLKSSIWDAIQEALDSDDEEMTGRGDDEEEAGEQSISSQDAVFDLTAVVEDVETGEEAELPVIRLRRFR